MKKLLLFHIVALFVFTLNAQNLVPNPSFEEKSYCPSNFNQQQLKSLSSWSQVNEGTPDHFSSCSQKVGVPNNLFGVQSAKEGESYAGMAVYSPTQRNYREYLTTKLTRALNPGEMVCIEMYISTADYSKYVTDAFGLVLSENKLSQVRNQVIPYSQSLANPKLHMLDAYNEWVLISDVYTAKGGEQFLTIGNFKSDKELKILSRTRDSGAKDENRWSYIYVDNVSVKSVVKKELCSCENDLIKSLVVDPPLELSEYDKIKLDDIYFDFDKSDLKEDALVKLNDVYSLLRKNKAMYLEIDGHADVIGNDAYNLELSKKRAEAVIEHLVKRGIDRGRLNINYFGSKVPAVNEDTDQARAQNRRVEFQVLEHKYMLVQ